MGDFTVTMDLKTLIAVGALLVGGAVGWATLKADTNELKQSVQIYKTEAEVTHVRLDAVERQLVELTVTLRLKGVTP